MAEKQAAVAGIGHLAMSSALSFAPCPPAFDLRGTVQGRETDANVTWIVANLVSSSEADRCEQIARRSGSIIHIELECHACGGSFLPSADLGGLSTDWLQLTLERA